MARPRHAEIAPEARIGRGRRQVVTGHAEAALEPVPQTLQARIFSSARGAAFERVDQGIPRLIRRCSGPRAIIIVRMPLPSVPARSGTDLRSALRGILRIAAFGLVGCAASTVRAAEGEPLDNGGQCRVAPADPRVESLLQADPDDDQIKITSDTGELGRDGDALLSGNVTIRTGQRLLTADQAELSSTERRVQLKGRMEYLDPRLHVRGQAGSFVEGAGGTFEGAEFELPDHSVRGAARSASVGPTGILELKGVRYTACPPGIEDWELAAGEITIDQKKQMGTGRDVKLEFLGVPILYTPWISFPVGDQRKSGLLFPTIGNSSRNGTLVAVPYYFNLAPNYDATLTTRYYSSRGVRLDPELRYPERGHAQPDQCRVPGARQRTRRGPQLRRLAARHALRATHAFARRRCGRQRPGLFRGFRRRFRRHERDLPEPVRRFPPRRGPVVLQRARPGLPGHRPRAARGRRAVPDPAAADGARTLGRPVRRVRRRPVRRSDQFPAQRCRPAGHPGRRTAFGGLACRPGRRLRRRECKLSLYAVHADRRRSRVPTNRPAVHCRRPTSIPASSSNAPQVHAAIACRRSSHGCCTSMCLIATRTTSRSSTPGFPT